MKPKTNRNGQINKPARFDSCQTPFYALDPLIPYLPKDWLIWESAAGDCHVVQKLTAEGFAIFGSDILSGHNFFTFSPERWDCQVTNPPYSIKYDWLKRSYELGKPFALYCPWKHWAQPVGNVYSNDTELRLSYWISESASRCRIKATTAAGRNSLPPGLHMAWKLGKC